MPNVWSAVHDTLERAGRFLDDSTGLFSAAVDLTAARQVLDGLLTTFTEALCVRRVCSLGARDWTAKQQQLNAKLRQEQMRPIAAVAELTLQGVPEFRAFKMPKQGIRAWEFIVHARAMADAAALYKEAFFKGGLPLAFVDDLKSAIAMFEESVSDREYNLVQLMSARLGLELAAKQGRVVLRVLDALVRQAARDKSRCCAVGTELGSYGELRSMARLSHERRLLTHAHAW